MGEAPAAVRVLAVSRVAPAPAPPAAGAVKVKLSLLDALWIATPPTQRVFLYELGGGEEFPSVVSRLKESLAATLALYLPLAGKLAYMAETGDVVVDCSDGDAGVTFVEAEADGGGRMDLRRMLAVGDAHDAATFLALVPEHDARVLPAPVLLLQATRLGGSGGLALGMSVHHAVADGHAVARFMDAWASAARGGSLTTVTRTPPPHYGPPEAIAHPRAGELAREVLKALAPNLPVANAKEDYFSQRFRLARQTFHFGAGDIRWLRRRIDALAAAEASGDADADAPDPVSRFVALCALGWTAFVRAKSLAAGDDVHLLFQAELRARLRPPVGGGYFGNCIRPCLASADAGELLGAAGLLRAARAIRVAVTEVEAAPLAGMERWVEQLARLPVARLVWVAGSPLLGLGEAADFGFGRPARTEPLTMNHDGRMVLGGDVRDGEAQVTVSLEPAHMDEFKAHMNWNRCPMPKI